MSEAALEIRLVAHAAQLAEPKIRLKPGGKEKVLATLRRGCAHPIDEATAWRKIVLFIHHRQFPPEPDAGVFIDNSGGPNSEPWRLRPITKLRPRDKRPAQIVAAARLLQDTTAADAVSEIAVAIRQNHISAGLAAIEAAAREIDKRNRPPRHRPSGTGFLSPDEIDELACIFASATGHVPKANGRFTNFVLALFEDVLGKFITREAVEQAIRRAFRRSRQATV